MAIGMKFDIEAHLESRGLDLSRTSVLVDDVYGTATFLLYNLSGKLVGYQEYNPRQQKLRNNGGRYYTYITGRKYEREIGVWGVETIHSSKAYLFLVEGIFDAVKIHNTNEPCIAILGNAQTKAIKSWFRILRKKIIVICDNDSAGRVLAKFGTKSFSVPEPHKDLGEMPQSEVDKFVGTILTQV